MKVIKVNIDEVEAGVSLRFFIRSKLIEQGIILQPPISSPHEVSGFDYFRPVDGCIESYFESHTNTFVFTYHEPSDIYIDPNKWATEKDADPIKDILEGKRIIDNITSYGKGGL